MAGMTKAAAAKAWTLNTWADGSKRSYPEMPSWFGSMTDKTWAAVAGGAGYGSTYQNGNRAADVISDAGTTGPNLMAAYTGACVCGTRLVHPACGGHGDRSLNDVISVNVRSEQPGYVLNRAETSDRSGGDTSNNGAANYGDGRPRSIHGYERFVGTPTAAWLTAMDAMATGGVSYSSSASFRFNIDGNGDWDAYSQALDNTQWSGGAWLGGASCYDPTTGYIWTFAQGTSLSTDYCCYVRDASTGTVVRRYKGYMPYGYGQAKVLWNKSPKVIVLAEGFNPSLRYLDISSLPADDSTISFTALTTSGTILLPGGGSAHGGMVYHPAGGSLYFWDGTGTRSSINKVPIPNDVTGGTYTGSTVAADGSNTVTPSAAQANGTFGRFNLIENVGEGRDALVIVNAITEPLYVYKLPAAGL